MQLMIETIQEYKTLGHPESNHLWLLTSFLAFLFLGVGLFLSAYHPLNPYLVKALVSAGFLTAGLFLCPFYWNRWSSTLIIDSKLAPGMLSAITVGICNNFGNMAIFIGFAHDPDNAGVVTIMIVGSALLSAILVYFLYKEKLTRIQIFGMVICFIGLVIIAYQAGMKNTSTAF